jgi:Ca2+-binding EF-hand superfamily protein
MTTLTPVEKLSDEQVAEYREAFQLMDKDNDNFISIRELDTVLRSLGYDLTQDQITETVHVHDRDDKGGINLDQFYSIMQKLSSNVQMDEIVREAFSLYDKDKDGLMNAADVQAVMRTLGEKISDSEAQNMIAKVDRNADGKITSDEFARLLVLK